MSISSPEGEFQKGIKTSTASLLCSIDDTYILGLKHAHLIRKIIYSNPSETKQIEIDFAATEHIFSHFCTDFIATIDGETVSIDKIHDGNYSKSIVINKSTHYLQPNKNLEIVIQCRWKNFYNLLQDCLLCFSYKQTVLYKLTIQDLNIKERKYKILIDGTPVQESDIRIEDNEILFFHNDLREIDNKKGINIRLLIANTPNSLNVFDSMFNNPDSIFKDYIIVLIQHLLSDFIHLVEKLKLYGCEKENIFICGIPYSTKETTVEYLSLSGYSNIHSPSEYPFEIYIKEMLRKAIQHARTKNKEIIVIEDGGYIFPILYSDGEFTSDCNLFKLIVEQTTNGINRDEEIIKDKKLVEYVPIIDVARSELKTKIESELIGKTVVFNLEQLLAKEFRGLEGKIIGLVGYGNTGGQIAEILVGRGAIVKMYDPRIDRKLNAEFSKKGIQVVDTPIDAVKDSHIVLEASGSNIPWADMNVVARFKNAAYFLSSSSKRLGINYNDFNSFYIKYINLPGIGKRYYLSNGNYITLLADGFPVNFFLGESVPDYQIQFIICLLFGAAYLGIKNKTLLTSEIISMNKQGDKFDYYDLQERIKKIYYYSTK